MRLNTLCSSLMLVVTMTLSSAWSHGKEYAAGSVTTEKIIAEAASGGEWLSHGRDYQEQRFSPLKQINTDNVADLGLAWHYDTRSNRGLEATPIVVDGVMYVSGVWSVVYALDAKTGKELWVYDPKVPKEWGQFACCDAVNRGVAVYQGKVIVGTLDGRLVAIDAKTGEQVWETLTIDKNRPYTITGAPRVAKGKVYIGNGGAEYGVRGYVSAYDVDNGELIWRFFTVPGDPKLGFESEAMANAADTWSGEWYKYGGGGTVWDSIVYDPELDQLYIGVGNGGPFDLDIRSPEGGDNLYVASIVALNPDSGEYIWHRQQTPGDMWDYTSTQQIMLADMEIAGEARKVIWQAPKNGFFFVIDRETGEMLSAEPYTAVNWASGYDLSTGRPNINRDIADYRRGEKLVRPAHMGAHNWHPMAYSPETGYVYIPVIEAMVPFRKEQNFKFKPGRWNSGIEMVEVPPGDTQFAGLMATGLTGGRLVAWDPRTQSEAWSVEHKMTWNGGVLATAGNLVFQGNAAQRMAAYRADTGERLWDVDAQTGIIAAPISYSVDGEQYIAVAASWGGILPLALGVKPYDEPSKGRILVYKLGGSDALPPLKAAVEPPIPPARTGADEQTLAEGKQLYHLYCYGCHGTNAVSGGMIPDLRYLNSNFHDMFEQIVYDGALKGLGMVGFSDVLDKPQVASIHAYIIEEANDDLEYRQQPQWWRSFKHWVYGIGVSIIEWLSSFA
ncbi:quinohemoprotein ethanol dehydrogenase [Sinobacterium caligoides]|uniref:Quinohemoprotein ethanol dehydrogenase n=2 Tax=Sinobacterium caligoides TaxID=933926 RepID=A0A3N2DZ55_9GAMM|nr:quinohemoprotein ethanol dehydrogenase [Sinobacterium caligoides]